MKTLFNPNENAAKILSHSAMKQVLGGYDEEESRDDGGVYCRIRCTGSKKEGSIIDCWTEAGTYCGGSGFDYCSCD